MSVTPIQAECAIAVAEVGSFRRAATQLFLSQPSVSAHVQSLERTLGVTMFDRDAAGARLTPEGQRVLPYLRAFLDQREVLMREAEEIQIGASSVIRVAGDRTPMLTFLVDALPVLQGTLGSVNVDTEHVRGNGSARLVDAGMVDIGLPVNNWATRPKLPNVEMVVLAPAYSAVYVPPGHRLAEAGEIETTELANETVVTIGGKNGDKHRDLHLGAVAGVRTVSTPDLQAAFAMASAMQAPVLGDTLAGVFAGDGWARVDLRGAVMFDYVICRRHDADHSPAAAALWRLMVARATADGAGQVVG